MQGIELPDRELLNLTQAGSPLVAQPYSELGMHKGRKGAGHIVRRGRYPPEGSRLPACRHTARSETSRFPRTSSRDRGHSRGEALDSMGHGTPDLGGGLFPLEGPPER